MDPSLPDEMLPSTQHTFDHIRMDEAIRNGDFNKASELAKTGNCNLSFFHWWTWAMKSIEYVDTKLQKDFRALLIDLPTRETLLAFLHFLLRGSGDERTALLVLEQYPDQFFEELKGQCAFRLAVQNGKIEILNLFLKFVSLQGGKDSFIPLATAITGSSWDGRHEIIEGNATILDIAASMGHIEIVEALVTFERTLLDHGYPLHAAVSKGRLKVVEYLLSQKVELVESFTPEPNSRSVLTMIRHTRGIPDSEKIVKILVSAIIKARGEDNSPAMIRKLLKGFPAQHHEIYLDLSMISQPTYTFKPMVEELIQAGRLGNISFHPTMIYVAFPFLDPSHSNSCALPVGSDAGRVLQWLRATKGVSEILRLIVPGSAPRAESENVIPEAISGLSIVSLDWRVLDLSIDIIFQSESRGLEELHLYSSGNRGVLDQWSGPEGVILLPKLKRLNVIIVKGLMPEEHEQHCIQRLEDRFAELTARLQMAPGGYVSIKARGWKELHPSCGWRLTQSGAPMTTLTITKLTNFLNFYKTQEKSCVNVKVAIIDNGVDGTLPTLSNAVRAGVSLDEDEWGGQDPWWLASHPHGTQMASFVYQLDPFCHLYIAKVCNQATCIDPDIVADAIYWAIEQKVDIISMSITMPRGSGKLEKAVESAKSDDIVIFSSRSDQGNNHEEIYPADLVEVISISALTNFGKRAETTEPNARYYFQGENVQIPAEPCYLEPQVRASGSSVATALAAGVASLVLSCRWLGGSEARKERYRAVNKVFGQMTDKEPGSSRYVKPWRVFDYENVSENDGLKWLETRFGNRALGLT